MLVLVRDEGSELGPMIAFYAAGGGGGKHATPPSRDASQHANASRQRQHHSEG